MLPGDRVGSTLPVRPRPRPYRLPPALRRQIDGRRSRQLQAKLAGLLSQHEPTLTDDERADLAATRGALWLATGKPADPARADCHGVPRPLRPGGATGVDRSDAGRRPVDELRRSFRERLARGRRLAVPSGTYTRGRAAPAPPARSPGARPAPSRLGLRTVLRRSAAARTGSPADLARSRPAAPHPPCLTPMANHHRSSPVSRGRLWRGQAGRGGGKGSGGGGGRERKEGGGERRGEGGRKGGRGGGRGKERTRGGDERREGREGGGGEGEGEGGRGGGGGGGRGGGEEKGNERSRWVGGGGGGGLSPTRVPITFAMSRFLRSSSARRGAARVRPRALLRPRLRVRRHPGLAPPARDLTWGGRALVSSCSSSGGRGPTRPG